MKIKVLIVIILQMISGNLYSQSFQWNLLLNSPGISGNSRYEDIYFINANTGWLVGYGAQAFRTTNAGLSWDTLPVIKTGANQFRSVGFFDTNVGLIGTLDDTIRLLHRTTNGGFNWVTVTNFTGSRPLGICGISIVNQNVAYACGRYFGSGRVIKTTNKGASWNLVFSDTSLAKSLVDCYFWTADSGIAVGGNGNAVIIKTTNGGASWQRVCRTTRANEWCWKISFISREIGFVSIERSGFSYILKTTNNGDNWIEIPFMDYNQEGIGFVNEHTGWVGGWTGPTYQTTNGGANWQLAGWGTNLNRFRFLSDTLGYAVGDRVYKYSRLVGVQNISTEIPNSYKLYQNYPNPFNPETVISYSLTKNSLVTLKVFDVLGNEIATLVNEKQNPGSYNYQFSTVNYQLSSGIYFYKIEAGDFIETKRMMLLK